jgi:hypothetical protein
VVERPSWAGIGTLMQDTVEHQLDQCVGVLLVGAGVSGIGIAYYLQTRCPTRSFTILEAREEIGGTWDLFRYPGVSSDMYTFGYSFRPVHPGGAATSIARNARISKADPPEEETRGRETFADCCACGLRCPGRASSGRLNVVELAYWSALMPRLFRPLSALCLFFMGPFCTI